MPWIFKNIALFKNWPSLYFGSVDTMETRSGLSIKVLSRHDIPILHEVLAEKAYGDLADMKNAKTIIDIGANIGSFTLLALQSTPKAHLYAFEPATENYELLQTNIARNKFSDRCTLFKEAVAGAPGERVLHIAVGGDSGHNSLRQFSTDVYGSDETVAAVTLDSILEQTGPCDLLKIDCEGSELEILENCTKLNLIHKIIFEWHDIDEKPKIFNLMEKAGFHLTENPTRESMAVASRD